MAHIDYYNTMRDIMNITRSSHLRLIEKVCMELGCPERSDELASKFIDESIKLKKFKDTGAPKKAKTSYMLFCGEKRIELKEKQPNLSFGEVMRALSKAWGELSEDERKKYGELAEADKERYAHDLEVYTSKVYSSTTSCS